MNGFTNPTGYYFRPNTCQCGHDWLVHTQTLPLLSNPQTNTCLLCVKQGGNNQRHFFAHRMETTPSLSFLPNRRQGYCSFGSGMGFAVINASNASTLTVGTTVIPFNTANVRLLTQYGATTITPIPANFANEVSYQVTGVVVGVSVSINPPLLFNIGITQQMLVYGNFGSTQGPGCPGDNYQRGG